MKTQSLSIDKIRIDGGTQPRTSIETAYVAELAERLDDLPPVDVFFDGTDHWLAEGFHRYHARRKAGKKAIDCIIHKGTQRDAILFSVGANDSHGLRRTNADKRKAVETLLADKEWGGRSDRWIAEACKVSNTFVGEMRGSTVNGGQLREGKDGKVRSLPTATPDTDSIDIPIDDEPSPPPPTLAKPSKPEPIKDKLGTIIEDPEIAAIFRREQAGEIHEILKLVSAAKVVIEKGVVSNDELFFRYGPRIHIGLKVTYDTIKGHAPYALCPFCRGAKRITKDCAGGCNSTGWMTQLEYQQAIKQLGGKR